MPQDETMSQDAAFTTSNNNDNTFVFDEVEQTEQGQPDTVKTETADDTTVPPATENEGVDEVSEEARVPYSRLKTVVEQRDQLATRISTIEEQLASQAQQRETAQETLTENEMPREWIALYGDGPLAQQAWNVQLQREQKLMEQAEARAVTRIKQEEQQEAQALKDNEALIDESLASLQDKLGKKLTSKQEEDILSIVDEFSPADASGKYLSVFPFDKAYEIYELRNLKTSAPTKKARLEVADLAGVQSEGDVETTSSPYKRGWDGWEAELRGN